MSAITRHVLPAMVLPVAVIAALVPACRAAELVVVEARGVGLNPGQMVDDAKPLVLKEGQHVTLIAVNGATLKLDGPYDKAPGVEAGGSGGEFGVALKALVTQDKARAEAGVTRAGLSKVTLPDPWLMDVSRSGNVCLRAGAAPVFYRETTRVRTELVVMPGDHSWQAQASWQPGADRLVVPGDLPLHGGNTYLVTLGGNQSAVTVNIVPSGLSKDEMRAAWMAHVGCEAQAEALVKTLP